MDNNDEESITESKEANTVKQPSWFYAVCFLAILWNLLGAIAVGLNVFITPEQIAQLPQAQQDLHATTPTWSILASMIAVIFGTLGSLLLILKKALAEVVLIISLLALVVQDIGMFIIVDGIGLAGVGALVIQVLVFIIALSLVLLAKKGKRETWLS